MASKSATALNLFGGKKEGGEAAGGMGGMMDQLAMFKKAQEIAQKKGEIEKELQLINFEGKSENGKVECTMKYLPSGNPMDPQPEFEVQGFDFDDEWFESAAPEQLATAATEAYRAGVQATMTGSEEKFKALAADLQEMMGGAAGPQ
jgi:DNA-binding protein YbaB